MKKQKKRNRIISKMFAVLIALIGGAVTILLVAGEEEEELLTQISMPALSVEILAAQKTDYRLQVPAWGIVEACEIIDICTEVPGKVAFVSDGVFAGAPVTRDTHLFSLDERSFKNTLAESIAILEQAKQALAIERGRQIIAKTEWKLLNNSKWQGNKDRSLVLREPHLKEREAALEIAIAGQNQAALDVERARVTAPCDGIILAEALAVGQRLDTGDTALQLACTECYFVKAMFSPEYSMVRTAGPVSVEVGSNHYSGIVKAVLPQINPETRHKQALVEFKGKHVTLGAYVLLNLPGSYFKNVVLLPRDALRPESTVWMLSEENMLEIREVQVLARDFHYVVISEGVAEGDRVILSHIASPLQGMPLGLKTSDTGASQRLAGSRGQHR